MFEWLDPEITSLLFKGLVLTIILTGVTSVFSLALGVFIGILKLSQRAVLPKLAMIYIEIFRNIPALVLIIFFAFAFPNLFPPELRSKVFFDNQIINAAVAWTGLSVPYYTLAAGLALTLNTSAYLAEIFWAGVGTIHQDYIEASRTLGANQLVVLRRIIIPQGLRAAFPAISNRLIHNMKNTALAAFVATPEFFHGVQSAITRSFRALELLTLAALVYLLLSFSFSSLLGWIDDRMNRQPLATQNR